MTYRRANTDNSAKVEAARRRWVMLAALGCWSLLPHSAWAHQGHRSYCSVQKVPGGLDVSVQLPVQQLVEGQSGQGRGSDDAAIERASPQLREELERHLRATTPNGECELVVTGPTFEGQTERNARFELSFSCPAGAITLGNDYRLDADPTAEMLCAIDGNAHVFRRGAEDYPVGTPPAFATLLLTFLRLGAEHVFGGVDHVLFVLSLLLGAANAAARDARRALPRVVGLVTGFTLGHSITLVIATLGLVTLPTRFTESMIALSIVLVAVHNLLEENPRARNLTSAAFGLIHGFGFASALAEVGLPRRGHVAALLSFNVGIELAQLALVLAIFPLLLRARQRPWFRRRLLVPACSLIAALGALWLLERALNLPIFPGKA